VRGDERKLRQILLNLLSNALKYTKRGSVTLCVAYDHADGDGTLRCDVIDTGRGIPPDKLEAIFEPFTQLARDGQVREGTGLGLNITRRLLELMNGGLTVESVVGTGSIFHLQLELPLVADPERALESTEISMTGYRGERKRILVVDDNVSNTALLVSLLEPLGFLVDTAPNGLEAFRGAQERQPDLVLMDLVMPVMDGLEAIRRFRADPRFNRTVIIGASASVTDSGNSEFIHICDDFVIKPIRIDLLLEKIGSHLGIEWETREIALPARGACANVSEEDMQTPPPAELGGLLDLAMSGNTEEIERWADELAKRDARYRAFAGKLKDLAGSFKTKAILALVKQCSGEEI
jgi:CheY-like chemotaxis protein/anti-sigma regulatory factor (Ser/Thr protein kinase)